ncbi:16493_t:CDS:2, partial [Gigaspora rosea]
YNKPSYKNLSSKKVQQISQLQVNTKKDISNNITGLKQSKQGLQNSDSDRKVRYLAEKRLSKTKGSVGLNLEEINQILDHRSTSVGHLWGLLKCVFFSNAIFLGLQGGEHYLLKASSFI